MNVLDKLSAWKLLFSSEYNKVHEADEKHLFSMAN